MQPDTSEVNNVPALGTSDVIGLPASLDQTVGAGHSTRPYDRRGVAKFPSTSWSAVTGAAGDNPALAAEALNRLCRQYRAAIVRWFGHAGLRHADAEDATQEFLCHVFSGARLENFAPQEGRFRSWLLKCLRHFAADLQRRVSVVRRGGGVGHEDVAQVNPPAPIWPADAVLDRDLAVEIHGHAVDDLRQDWEAAGEAREFVLLSPFLVATPGPGEYARVGQVLGLPPARIKRLVFNLREKYFDRFRARVAASVEPTELADELKYLAALLAADPPAVEI